MRVVVDDGYSWALQAVDTSLIQFVDTGPVVGQNFRAVFLRAKAVKAGTTQLRTVGDPACRSPPCQVPSKTYQLTLVVR